MADTPSHSLHASGDLVVKFCVLLIILLLLNIDMFLIVTGQQLVAFDVYLTIYTPIDNYFS